MLPHPEHLERFEQLLPGATDRMLSLAENQIAHRHGMERKFLNFNGASEILGVVFAGAAVLSGIAGGIYLLMHDKPIGGLTSMIVPLASVAAAFLRTRNSQSKQLERKK